MIFVINNDGYIVERMIYGMKEFYNDICMWDYKLLFFVFGGDNVLVYDVNILEEFMFIFENIKFNSDCMYFVEVKMVVEDVLVKLSNIVKVFVL